jgi:hypothetical protein
MITTEKPMEERIPTTTGPKTVTSHLKNTTYRQQQQTKPGKSTQDTRHQTYTTHIF